MDAKKLLKLVSSIALASCFSASAHAGFISGSIGFTGSVQMTGGSSAQPINTAEYSADIFQTSTGLDFTPGQVYTSFGTQSEDYASVGGLVPVTYNDFTFNTFSGPIAPLWSFTDAGKTYSFDLESVSVDIHNTTALVLSGKGTLNITGFDATPGLWTLTANRNAGNRGTTFNFSTDNSVPEPLSLSLMGIGLASLAARRKANKLTVA